MKELNPYNFITDLIFHPEHAEPKDQKKSLAITIALSILSLGAIPLTIGIGWGIGKTISWIKEKISETDEKTKEFTQVLLPSGLREVKEPIRYQKEAKGVPHIAPKNKNKLLGRGAGPRVYEHRNNSKLAIKIVSSDAKEYEIGAMLNHPVLARSHELYIKEYPGDKRDKYKLVMEKVEGKKLTSFQQSNDAIPKATAVKLVKQAKECCIYLFRSGVYWKDVNDGNIFIENKTNNLRLIDFGYWDKEANSEERVKHLLIGAMELTTWIVGNSCYVKNNGVKDREKKKEIAFPEKFFGQQIQDNQIVSIYSYSRTSWMEEITAKLQSMDESQMEMFLSNYFDQVIDKLK